MKRILIAILCVACAWSSVYAMPDDNPNLSQSQVDVIQLDIDILGICIQETAFPYIQYGFSTEFGVAAGLQACENEGDVVISTFKEFGVTDKVIDRVMMQLIVDAVDTIDDARNKDAMKRLKKAVEDSKNNSI